MTGNTGKKVTDFETLSCESLAGGAAELTPFLTAHYHLFSPFL